MSLLTEQEMQAMWNTASSYNPVWMWHLAYARAIEAKARANLLEEIKAQGNCIQYGEAGQSAKYYRLPEGD